MLVLLHPMTVWIEGVAPEGSATAVGTVVECDPFNFMEAAVVAQASKIRQNEFHTGRCLARAALAKLGCKPTAIIPDESRVPRWPAGFVGSISHSRSLCVAHVGASKELAGVGVDIEPDRPCPPEIVAQISRPDEDTRAASISDLSRFVAKEAFYKSYFPSTHTWLEFQDVYVELDQRREKFLASIVNVAKPSIGGRRSFEGHLKRVGDHLVALLWIGR